MSKLEFSLGADPELFMADEAGALKASCGRIGGTKDMPLPMGLGEGFMIQEDNVAVEFNIPPAQSVTQFRRALTIAIKDIQEKIGEMYKFHVVPIAAAEFPASELESDTAKVFGCDPDFNAWTKKKNPRPEAVSKFLRSCGGHVHVGLPQQLMGRKLEVIKAMDIFLGVPSVLMDEDTLRRSLYGKRGAFRDKPYGVEYRTLSNFWVFTDKHIDWVWRNTERALQAVDAQSINFDELAGDIEEAIDKNNKNVARELVKKYELEVV